MKVIIAYIPAIHKGYIDFINNNKPSRIYLLGLSLVREIPRLERDIRALESKEAVNALKGMGLSEVYELTKDNIGELNEEMEILMPDEDVSHHFKESYLEEIPVKFMSVFLRWDKHNALKKDIVTSDNIVSKDSFDKEIMGKAIAESEKSLDWWRQVGSIIIKDNKIIFTGFNKPLPSGQVHNIFGDPRSNFDYGVSFELSKFIHAEAGMIAEAAKRGVSLEGSSIYVTTFPCPACAKLIASSGIKKVYYKDGYSLLDAEDVLRSFDIEIVKVED